MPARRTLARTFTAWAACSSSALRFSALPREECLGGADQAPGGDPALARPTAAGRFAGDCATHRADVGEGPRREAANGRGNRSRAGGEGTAHPTAIRPHPNPLRAPCAAGSGEGSPPCRHHSLLGVAGGGPSFIDIVHQPVLVISKVDLRCIMADQGTRLESEEDVRRVLAKYRPAARGGLPATTAPAAADDCPPLFRPTQRPPTPILCVCDNGAEDGETIRIRKDRFVIGRTEGDLTIPHDARISSRHAELRQLIVKQAYRWGLIDLQSTNGTFVRVHQALLEHGQEFVIGGTRLRLREPAGNQFRRAEDGRRGGARHATLAAAQRGRGSGGTRGVDGRIGSGYARCSWIPAKTGWAGTLPVARSSCETTPLSRAARPTPPPGRWPLAAGEQQVGQRRVAESGADIVQGNVPLHDRRAKVHRADAAIGKVAQ